METCPPYKFHFPGNFGLYGMSQSGKSSFLANLIRERKHLFTLDGGYTDIHKIFFFYGSTYQPIFTDLADQEGVIFHKGLPDNIHSLFEPNDKGKPMLLIFDDLMDLIENDTKMFQLVFKDSHHDNLGVLFTFQTLFPRGKFAKSIREQFHVQVILRLPGEREGLARRLGSFTSKQRLAGLLEFYDKHVMQNALPGGYVIINNHPKIADSRLQFASKIFKNEGPTVLLVPQ